MKKVKILTLMVLISASAFLVLSLGIVIRSTDKHHIAIGKSSQTAMRVGRNNGFIVRLGDDIEATDIDHLLDKINVNRIPSTKLKTCSIRRRSGIFDNYGRAQEAITDYDYNDYFSDNELTGDLVNIEFIPFTEWLHYYPRRFRMPGDWGEQTFTPYDFINENSDNNISIYNIYTDILKEYEEFANWYDTVYFDLALIGNRIVAMSIFFSWTYQQYFMLYVGNEHSEYGVENAEELLMLLEENDYKIDYIGPISEGDILLNNGYYWDTSNSDFLFYNHSFTTYEVGYHFYTNRGGKF